MNLRRDRRGLAPRQRDRLVAARPDRARAAATTRSSPTSAAASPIRARAAGRSRRRSTKACRRHVLSAALFERFSSRGEADFADQVLSAMRHAVRRPRREAAGGASVSERCRVAADRQRAELPSDALVVFGFTGDLANKKIFPALYAMVERGTLTVPVIGVASTSLDTDAAARARARQPRAGRRHRRRGGVRPAALAAALRQRRLPQPETFAALKAALGGAAAGALPRHPAGAVRDRDPRASAPPGSPRDARVIVEKPFGRDLASARRARSPSRTPSSRRRRSSASTTTSARRRS